MANHVCDVCGTPFQSPRRDKRCSPECSRKHEQARLAQVHSRNPGAYYHPRCSVFYFTCRACEQLRTAQKVRPKGYCEQVECQRAYHRERMRALNARHREAGQSLWQKRRETLTDEQRRARDVRDIANSAESRRASSQKRRALKSGADAEDITAAVIYDRDGWVCGICSGPVDPESRYPHPKSPSLDHVVPLSLGGPHTAANVRLAHLNCNVRRGNRVAA